MNEFNKTTITVYPIPVDKIEISHVQVRNYFDENEIDSLAESIKKCGILQPILVIRKEDKFDLIAGERRLRASKKAGLKYINARILVNVDKDHYEIALRENIDRVDLHPIEEGEGYIALLRAELYKTHEDIAKSFGKQKSRVSECMSFAKLPSDTKNSILTHNITNRKFLREICSASLEDHTSMIKNEIKRKEILKKHRHKPTEKTDKRSSVSNVGSSFQYKMKDDGFEVPKFKWKKTDDRETLNKYIEEIKRLIEDLKDI